MILSYYFVLPALFPLVLHQFSYQSESVIMTTQSGRSFRERLNDSQHDEMLIRMMEQLDSLHTRMGNVEA